ncbi:MAG TPA: GC-type dockerin domain-anchored protein [Phycisphaerales bacterium]|nr:GC-type dockerin domain-anchored protein [Phycisphaerales bacterium]HMP37712.1 GC-type dockerin domain-anchored protein [Phycisphaerales bacterium]
MTDISSLSPRAPLSLPTCSSKPLNEATPTLRGSAPPAAPHRRGLSARWAAALLTLPLLIPAASSTADCLGDLDNDGVITGGDLGVLLAAFGTGSPAADLDGNGVVDGADLGILLSLFGERCGEPGEVVRLALAGRPLTADPWFNYTFAFHAGQPVRIFIDPGRFPELAGSAATVYLVAARSEAEWANDATLVDVRASGPQSIVIPGGAPSSNVFVVDSGTLPGSSGAQVGVNYDIVVDLDGSGTLSAGDLIDGLDGPGFAVVSNLNAAGAYATSTATYTVTGVTAGFTGQRAYWPSNLATLGPRPLVIISHGNGHQYTWYDWLGTHLASYGFVVVSHANNTQAGVEAASTTTLQHTQAVIAQQATIAGGALAGLIDTSRIVWIGHSRGGEGVVRAYDRIFDGTFTPTNFTLSDIKLVSSIAPTDFLGTNSANPHAVPYHLLYGAADGDVCGCPNNNVAQSFNLFERATGWRVSTYIHGADHNDFNCCGINDFNGPAGTEIGRPEAQRVGRVTYAALLAHVMEGSLGARDLLWRHYEEFRPPAVAATTTVVNDLRPGPASTERIIDNFQSAASTAFSSSGGAVTWTVSNLIEGLADDNNTSFTWLTTDPMNGLTRARTSDTVRCAAFDFAGPAFIEFEVVPALRDVSAFTYLAFRAAQGTRHPQALAQLGNLTFRLVLVDGAGNQRGIDLAPYGVGIQQTYARTGFGTGAGWQAEFELVRIRLDEFLAGGAALDLADITAIRFEFGAPGQSAQGRLFLDDIRFSTE